MSREATLEELNDTWAKVGDYWNNMPDKMEYPWVEAAFKVAVFRITLNQRWLRIPTMLGSASVRRG